VRSLVPYLLRYVFYRNHVHYVTLRKPWKYYSTAVWTAKCPPPAPPFPAGRPARPPASTDSQGIECCSAPIQRAP